MNNKEAIDLLLKSQIFLARHCGKTDMYNAVELAIKALEKRPQGEWIEKVERGGFFAGDKTVYSYTCPFCGAKEFKKYPFCHCGADMRVKDELGGRE